MAMAAVVVSACVLAACGGHAVTRRELSTRADAVCAGATRALRALPGPATASPGALARYLAAVGPILDRESTDLRALPRPSTGAAGFDAFTAAQARLASEAGAAARAARRGDGAAEQAALARLRANPTPAIAARYGLAACTGAEGTAPSL